MFYLYNLLCASIKKYNIEFSLIDATYRNTSPFFSIPMLILNNEETVHILASIFH